jgi:hypothetical protein
MRFRTFPRLDAGQDPIDWSGGTAPTAFRSGRAHSRPGRRARETRTADEYWNRGSDGG